MIKSNGNPNLSFSFRNGNDFVERKKSLGGRKGRKDSSGLESLLNSFWEIGTPPSPRASPLLEDAIN